MDMIVHRGRKKIVRKRDRVEVAGEVQIDVFHRHDLRITTTRRSAFHAEYRAERRFAQADDCLLADSVERIAESDRGRRLAFARWRRADRGDEYQLSVFAASRLSMYSRDTFAL